MIMARKTSTAVTMLGMELIVMKPVTPMLVTRLYDKDVGRYLGIIDGPTTYSERFCVQTIIDRTNRKSDQNGSENPHLIAIPMSLDMEATYK